MKHAELANPPSLPPRREVDRRCTPIEESRLVDFLNEVSVASLGISNLFLWDEGNP